MTHVVRPRLHDTVFTSYRIGALFTRNHVHFISGRGSVYTTQFGLALQLFQCMLLAPTCAAALMDARLVELIMRFRIELIPASTVYTRYRIGFIPLSGRFRLKTRKRYEAYRLGAFSFV